MNIAKRIDLGNMMYFYAFTPAREKDYLTPEQFKWNKMVRKLESKEAREKS